MIRLFLVAPLLLLTACATPEQRCIADATEDLRVVNRLIAETRANLERGYAIEKEPDTSIGISFCAGNRGRAVLCTQRETEYRDRPVAFDRAAEERKLADLEAKRLELEVRTRRDLKACDALA